MTPANAGAVSLDINEFRFLPGDAARVARTAPLPDVRRVGVRGASGQTISALRFVQDQAPEFVFLHGAGLNAHGFDPTVLALGAPALSIDLPGHGRSDWRDDADYRPRTLATDVSDALRQFVSSPVVLVGHSLGALTAALVAECAPELVSRLVMIDITPGISPSRDAGSVTEFITGQRSFASLDEAVERAIRFGIGSDRVALTRGVALNTRLREDGRLEWTHHFAHLDSLPPQGAPDTSDKELQADSERSTPYAHIWTSLQSSRAPLTLVSASSGLVSDELLAEWRELLPQSAVIEIDGPHNLHEAAPAALAKTLAASAR